MTTDFGNHIIYNMTIDFGHSLHVQYNYNWRLTQKLQDGIWLRFAKKKDCIQPEGYIRPV